MKILGINFCIHDWVELEYYWDGWTPHRDEVCIKCKEMRLKATEAKNRQYDKDNKRGKKYKLAKEIYKEYKDGR